MSITRRRARADLAGIFDDIEPELENVIENWSSEEAQSVLRALAAKLTKKKSG